MDKDSYYVAPSDEIFNAVKEAAIELWRTYDDTYGYATEKVNRIKDIGNIKDNCCYIVAMFDSSNQNKLVLMLDSQRKFDATKFVIDLLLYGREGYSKEV